MYRFEYDLNEIDLAALKLWRGTQHLQGRYSRSTQRRYILGLTALITLLMNIIIFKPDQSDWLWKVPLTTAAIFVLVSIFFKVMLIPSISDQQLPLAPPTLPHSTEQLRQHHLELTEQFVRHSAPGSTVTIDWSYLTQVVRDGPVLYLACRNGAVLILPRRAVDSGAEWEAIVRFIERHIPLYVPVDAG